LHITLRIDCTNARHVTCYITPCNFGQSAIRVCRVKKRARTHKSWRWIVYEKSRFAHSPLKCLYHRLSNNRKSLHLMGTINAKKRWTTIYWRVNKFLKESHIVTRKAKERASLFYSVSGNANSMAHTKYASI
jgi:hypothetical protein